MAKLIKATIILLLIVIMSVIALWFTIPAWLPPVVNLFLPAGSYIELSQRPHLINQGISLAGINFRINNCQLANTQELALGYRNDQFYLTAEQLDIDSACLAQFSKSEEIDSSPISLADIQQQLPLFEIRVNKVSVAPWQQYDGKLLLKSDTEGQVVDYHGPALTLTGRLNKQQYFSIKQLEVEFPDGSDRLALMGGLTVPMNLDRLPVKGELAGKFIIKQLEQPLLLRLNWEQQQGTLTVKPAGEAAPLINLPWLLSTDRFEIQKGEWRWPYAEIPLSGGISLKVSDWNDNYSQALLQARLNIITDAHGGKGNAVLTFGPDTISLTDNQLRFQLTGKMNLDTISFYASIPGMIKDSLTNPNVYIHSGALLRAKGDISPVLQLKEARWPLAGIKLSMRGISGRLQAILNAKHRYWGDFKLHLDGKAEDFLPDNGLWQWKFWGSGNLPPLKSKWDVAGNGQWQDSVMMINAMTSGFDQMKYGGVNVAAPRLTLTSPLIWLRLENKFNAQWQLQANKVTLASGGYLPKATLTATFGGKTPSDFNWNGNLRTEDIGPIRLNGRWDGTRLRGDAWWPKQPLEVFQTLLPADSGFKIRNGVLNAQMAFSAAENQGFEAGGHFVVKDGGMWLEDGELYGLDFIASYRLKDHLWQIGSKGPVLLRIKQISNLLDIQQITADLQGTYPFSKGRPLILSNVSMNTLGGTISLSKLELPQQSPAIMKLDKIDLSQLITVLKPKQVAMSGRINGELPLYLKNPEWLVRNGWIENEGNLTLRLDKDMVDAIDKDNMVAGAVMDWLRYIEISRSRADVNISNLGEITLDAQIKGLNSMKSKERSVVLNYHHEENIFQLWRSLRFANNLQEVVEQQLTLPRSNN